MNRKTLVSAVTVLAAAILIGNVVVAPYIFTVLLRSHGRIIREYELTFNPTEIDWGNVTLNTPVTRNTTITNVGHDVASLNMTYNATSNLINYTLTWDAEGQSLPYAASLTVNFTLTVYEFNWTVTDQFSIDINIRDQT